MVNEIVYVCNSINNKNIRGNELKILRKVNDGLFFEFGESEENIKKRFYSNIETLEKDFAEIEKIKQKLDSEENEEPSVEVADSAEEVSVLEEKVEPIKKTRRKYYRKDTF